VRVDALSVYAWFGGRTFLDVFGARGTREPGGARALVRVVFGRAFRPVLARSRSAMILQLTIGPCDTNNDKNKTKNTR